MNMSNIDNKPRIDYTYGYSLPTGPYIQLPPFQILNAFYLTNLPPSLNYVNKFEQEEKRMNLKQKKAEQQQKDQEQGINEEPNQIGDELKQFEDQELTLLESEVVSISFVDRNGYSDTINSYFDPKIYFGGHPAIVCEFYAPHIKMETIENALMKNALAV
ncbi:MAG: hypothetical protein EZS28_010313 [Streblomastix strix]|uniref:Uncharacterized protein n=1 Tax=Streblomastix strix TaxID=222440 RepID=A0A5J4WGX6_9EUKA|nr:MAG: hypothetical protein EZS28_010313 [Streblomastix strix]